MEGERGLPPIYDHHLQISFSAPHQEMGFVQFEDHNQVLSFLVAPPPSQPSSQISQPLEGGSAAAKPTTVNNNGSLGFNHNELVNRPSWNNDQVVGLSPLSLSPLPFFLFFFIFFLCWGFSTHCQFEFLVDIIASPSSLSSSC